jgi:hypothetical protein
MKLCRQASLPQGLKPASFAALPARLKPCPSRSLGYLALHDLGQAYLVERF